VVELPHESKSRDSISAVTTFDFFFKIDIPRPRKGREIVERYGLGRSVSTRVPEFKTVSIDK